MDRGWVWHVGVVGMINPCEASMRKSTAAATDTKKKAAPKADGKRKPKASAKAAGVRKRPAAAPASDCDIDFSDMLVPSDKPDMKRNTFTSRAYHTARTRAQAAGLAKQEANEVAKRAYSEAAVAHDEYWA